MWEMIGLTPVDEKTYRLLLRHPGLSAADCATRLELAPDCVGDSIDRLRQAGLLDGDRPRDPRVRFADLVDRRRAELERLSGIADLLAADYAEGVLRSRPAPLAEIIDG